MLISLDEGRQCNYNFTLETKDAALSLCGTANSREHVYTWRHGEVVETCQLEERELNNLAIRSGFEELQRTL
jgi:hypothetical protein